ncbi:hypothetical protein AB1484_18705 [Parafrankia sp. FMc6]|uniref:hypothetical protein n=1 Tax=Parafrankia soli TaxID=2599596 RepID=UPI0034D5811B
MLQLHGAIDMPAATVYTDDVDPLLAYVLPKTPILRRDGDKAVFKYVKYRTPKPLANGKFGAALVFMDVELALPPAQQQSLRDALAEQFTARRGQGAPPVPPDQIILSKPTISKATVDVEVLAASGELVQKVNSAGRPSMYGNNVVAISAELNQDGAPVFEAVMRSQGAGGVRVVYEMTFAARMPAIRAVGTWNASKFYTFVQDVDFEENFWAEDDFSERVTEIFTNSESRVVEVDPGGQASSDPAVAKILDTLRSSVTQQLDEAVKRNLLDAIPPESRDFSKVRQEDFENIRRDVTVNKTSDVHIEFKENQVVAVDVAPQANMPSLASQDFAWADYAMDVDTDDPFFRRLGVAIQVNAEFEALPIFSVEVKIDYPPHTARSGIQTFSFTKTDQIAKFEAFTDGGPTAFKYQYVVNYKGESRTFTSPWVDADTTELKVNIDELGIWLVDIEVGDINFDQVSRAVLTLEHPEVVPGVPPVCRFQITKDTKKERVQEVLLQAAQPYGGSITYFMQDSREYVRTFKDLKGQRFFVDDPFSGNGLVQMRTRGDFERQIDTIFVDLAYADDENDYRQTASFALTKDKRFNDWKFPVIDEQKGKVTYRTITTFRDGTSTESGDQTLTGRTLVLGEDAATISVRLIPDLIDWSVAKLATVDIHYADPAHDLDDTESFTFRKEAPEAKYEFAIRDRNNRTYTWKATYFLTDGSRKETGSAAPVSDEQLVLQTPS